MKDRVVEYPSRYRLTKVPGTDDIFDLVPVPGEVTEEGTYLNKATLLTDSTAALYGKDDTAVPENIFEMLSRAGLIPTSGNGLVDVLGNVIDLGGAKIQTGSYTGTGTYGASSPNSLTFEFAPKLFVLWGRYTPSGYAAKNVTVSVPRNASSFYLEIENRLLEMTSITWSGNTIRWYGGAANHQLNEQSAFYQYFAIG